MRRTRFLTTQEVVKRLGISKQTLFRYEKKGIFPKPKRNLINHWRCYNQEDITKLRKIMGGAGEP
ncbi:MAG TPA: hypothetical protein DEQ77_00455 [Candidatus Omnitrophica bacterium]|nr:hypothetical protein [Candidatus Omnitrophota bacterium]